MRIFWRALLESREQIRETARRRRSFWEIVFETGALTYQDIRSMALEERMELEEAYSIWQTEWKAPPPVCPLMKT